MQEQNLQPERTEPKPSSFPKVLIDTTLLFEQQKRAKHAEPVRRALSKYRFRGASSFSKLEFKYAWLQRLSYLYDVTRKPKVRSVLDVQEWINNKLHGLNKQRGRVQTLFQALFAFLELDSGKLTDEDQLARLRAHCKTAILDASESFEEMVTAEFKGTDCARAKELAREHPDGSFDVSIPRCKRGQRQCQVDHFFEQHRDHFAAIAEGIAAADEVSPELAKIREHILSAQVDAEHLRDKQNCRKIADAIIAVDGRDMDIFAANNDREWRTIASSMGKDLQNPVTGDVWPHEQ